LLITALREALMTSTRWACLAVLLLSLLSPSEARAQDPAPAGEIRGVWAHPGTFGTDERTAIPNIQSTLDSYVKAGINTVMILVKTTSGYVYYQSDIGVRDPAYRWDFFAAFLAEARKRKITVHPWFCVFTEGAMAGRVREHPEWLIRSKESELVPVVNPALPDVRAYEISLIKELVSKYAVEWVHLDYIRYPCEPTEDYFSFDAKTRELFKEYSGVDIAAVRATDTGNILWNEWIEWNGEQVTQFVRELRQSLKETGSEVKLSAAVFPDAGNARALIAQDWERWAREGLVEMLCPMLYTGNRGFFEKYLRRAAAIAGQRCLLAAGIGIGTADTQNSPAEVLSQIGTAHALGANGIVLFSSGSLTQEHLAALAR
jgi:uncharacterized lipoprotein YddW (UPF0748 family)